MTTFLVDNATLAAAGRALYVDQRNALGAEHAQLYYELHGVKAANEDRRSLFELVTALVLVDDLVWEGSSTKDPEVVKSLSPRDRDFGKRAMDAGGHQNLAWVYRWFPAFEDLRSKDVLKPTYLYGTDKERLELAQQLAVRWVQGWAAEREDTISDIVELVPKCYRDPKHPEREFVRHQAPGRLTEDALSLALFVSRGLFYDACAKAQNLEGYLPHSYRGVLLQDPILREAIEYTSLCDEGITGKELLAWLDETVHARAIQVATTRVPKGERITLGGGFFRGTNSPLFAWESAMKFRESESGAALRSHFRRLLELAAEDDRALIEAELREIDKQLLAAAQRVKGCLPDADGNERLLISVCPSWVKACFELLPFEWKRQLRRNGSAVLGDWSPYQLLFGAYLQAPKRGPSTLH